MPEMVMVTEVPSAEAVAGRASWDRRHALSTFIWLRTKRGPFNSWLHIIAKVESQNTYTVVAQRKMATMSFDCPQLQQQWRELIGFLRAWGQLDHPLWKRQKDKKRVGRGRALFRLPILVTDREATT
ncbi:hypothetical protein EV426DRAFT_709854 [Tirmania nivea]|nr:hypothetical protein EV426DRAFT_709854 [Tirmania nivea]